MTKKIQLIIGSTRENRLGSTIAEWVGSQAAEKNDIALEIVDLKQQQLPFMNAPVPPAYAPTATDAGKAWASKVSEADGYIFLTPEYNRSIPASLKNAIDYLVQEWKEKPAVIVSYGYIDGGKSAASHLRDILDWLKVGYSDAEVALHLKPEMFDDSGKFINIQESFAPYEEKLKNALQHFSTAKEPAAVA